MNSTKEMIVQTARNLFYERGYENITLRDIANACDISPGNLNYYFNKKEDLITTVMEGAYDDLYHELAIGTADTLADLMDQFLKFDETFSRHPYYFKNIYNLASSHEILKIRQIRFREQLFYYYMRSIHALLRNGALRDDITEYQYRDLALHLIMIQNTWYVQYAPTYDELFLSFTFFKSICNCLYPFLTPKGIEEWGAYFARDDVSK